DLGGLTPSIGMVEAVVATGIPVHVLVRPRPGGFRFSATEVSLMVRDIEAVVDAGAAGVVVGALTADGTLDRYALTALRDAARSDLGGLPPSIGMVEAVVATGIPVHVLVRPRPGGFRFSATEVSLMVRDIEAVVDAGAAGVVVGALTADGTLDRYALTALRDAA